MRRTKQWNPGWLALVLVVLSASAWSQQGMFGGSGNGIMSPPSNQRPPKLANVGIQQNLNQKLPLELTFRDETGKSVQLRDYFGSKPVILSLAYYNCQMLCPEVLSGLATALKGMSFDAGKEFDVLTVSFDPHDTPELAAKAKREYVRRYGRKGAEQAWHFLTGNPDAIAALTKATGFQYQRDGKTGQYAHTTAIMIVTPEGKISQYYYGVEYPPKDMRLGLVAASKNKIGNLTDSILLYCYHYDPATGRYGPVIVRVLRISGLATMLFLGSFIAMMIRRDSSHRGSGEERTT